MVRERRQRVARNCATRGDGTAATRGEEPQLYMVRKLRQRVVRERRLRVAVRSRSYAW